MNQLEQVTRVVFNEEGHTYVLDGGKFLKGITTIMKENGLSANYDGIAPEVLTHAAEMGTMAHKCIEDYCNGKEVVNNELIKSFRKLNLKVNCCEYLVTDYDSVASSIDMIVDVEDGVVDLIDMKRTAEVHRDALAWQLGIYKYLFEQINPFVEVRNCYCLNIKKGLKDSIEKDKCQPLILVEPISADIVANLLECVQLGLPFDIPQTSLPELPINANECENLIVLEKALTSAELLVKQYKLQLDDYRAKLMKYMTDNGFNKIAIGNGEYSLRKATTRTSIDSKKLKEEMPEIAEKYSVTTEVKGSITFKLIE